MHRCSFAKLILLVMLLLPFTALSQKKLDPAAWGSNHVGKPFPEYVHGDECLFCHRNDIGAGWQRNAHGITVRQREDAPELAKLLGEQTPLASLAGEIEYFLGSRRRVRFLKKAGYGKFALLNTQAALEPGARVRWLEPEKPAWNAARFANRCAGCHTTAVAPDARTFAAFGLDCFTCHGDVPLDHTKDTSLAWLSKKRRSDARAIVSICAQCHLRGGKSRSTGLPYANTFIAGDNLFQDFEFDFSRADDESLDPGERHIFRNVRDVVLYGAETPACLQCHRIHGQSSSRHRFAPQRPICFECHYPDRPFKVVRQYTAHNLTCEY